MDSQSIFSQSSSSMAWSQTNQVISHDEKIIGGIFFYLSVVDLRVRTVSVCKQWNRISKVYLAKEENQDYQKTRKSIELIIDYLTWHGRSPSIAADSLRNLLDDSNGIKSSLTLKRQSVRILENANKKDFFNVRTISTLDEFAANLINVMENVHFIKRWRDNTNNIKDDLGFVYPSYAINFKKIYEICLRLIELSAFETASKFALEIKSDNMQFGQPAEELKEEVFAKIAQALTKQGYFGSACEIANKNMYPDSPDRNSRYKSYVWTFISPELKQLNYNYQ